VPCTSVHEGARARPGWAGPGAVARVDIHETFRPTPDIGGPRATALIDPGQLASDIVGNSVSLVLPGLLWAAVFLLAFENGSFSASIGLGRRAFWLLLPGALASTFGNLPLFPVGSDIIGIGLSGGLFPILVGLLAFDRFAPPARRSLRLFLGGYAVLAVAGLLVVVVLKTAWEQDVGVVAVAAGVPLGAWVLSSARDAVGNRVAYLLALTSGVIVLTFVFSASVPGVGITEGFPQYLLAPVGVAAVAALVAPLALRGAEGLALPASFVAGTFGVLVGADVLRQPPLYPSSQPGLYIIGGAGVFDLVYLSGLLALATAFVAHRVLRRSWAPVGEYTPPGPTPVGRLARAFRAGVRGDLSGSLNASVLASRDAATQARQLLAVPEPPPDRPWQGLPVPGWVVADQANLEASAKAGTTDGRESYRGWLMARSLVQLSTHLTSRRFATAVHRTVAYAIDLALLTVPAVALWAYLAATLPGGYVGVASSVAYNTAIYGFISLAFLYFVIGERVYGTTLGKWIRGLVVKERGMRPASLLPVLVRNSFRLPTLSVLGIGLAIATEFLFVQGSSTPVSFGGLLVPLGAVTAAFFAVFVILGVGLLGVIGYLTISATSERQRAGDLLAGTWVVRRATPVRPSGARPAPAPAPSAPGSSG
jgi:uncharacterized RDD family membrane protein YckC